MACGKILVMFWALFSTFNIAGEISVYLFSFSSFFFHPFFFGFMSICLRYVSKFSSLILEGGPCLQIKSFFLFGFLFFCLFVFLPVVCITVLATESIRGFFALLFFLIGGQPSYRLSVFTLEFVFCIRRQNNIDPFQGLLGGHLFKTTCTTWKPKTQLTSQYFVCLMLCNLIQLLQTDFHIVFSRNRVIDHFSVLSLIFN